VKAPLRLETPRLVLAQPKAIDAEAVFERYASDPDVTRFLGWPRHQSIADTHEFLKFSEEEWERWPAGPYLIWSRYDHLLLGSSGFAFEKPDEAATGYVLAKDAWGKGFATEVLGGIVEIARQIGVARLYALCHPQHRPSWRVLEKAGFTRDTSWSRQVEFPNLAPGGLQDVYCYALVCSANATSSLPSPA